MGYDLRAPFGEDIVLVGSGDVDILGGQHGDYDFVVEREELIQRIIRRLLTPKGEWIPFPEYGASLRERVHDVVNNNFARTLKADILEQLAFELDILTSPPPVVEFSSIPNGVMVYIKVITRALQPIDFSFNPRTT